MTPGRIFAGALVVLNCFLLVLLLNAQGTINVASGQLAGTTNDRAGNYLAVTGQHGANEQVLYLINVRTDQMVVYQFYRPRRWMEVFARVDLTRDFDKRQPEFSVNRSGAGSSD